MRPRFSLSRFAFGYIALAVLALALFAILLWYGYRTNLGTFRAYVPGAELQRLVDIFHRDGAQAVAAAVDAYLPSLPSDEIIVFVDPGKRRLAGNLPAWPAEVPEVPGTYGLVIGLGGDASMRVVTTHVTLPGGYYLLMGRESVRFQSLVERFWYGIVGAMAIVLALGALIAWRSRRTMLAEVDEISRAASAIVRGDLSRRLPLSGGAGALDTLAQAVNGMLGQLEQRYALVMNASDEGFWDWNMVTDEFYTSPRLLEICGFPPGTTFAGRKDFRARFPFHPEDRVKWRQAVDAHFAGKTARLAVEARLLLGSEVRWIYLIGLATRDASGAVVRWIGATTDITERKRAEILLAGEKRALERIGRGEPLEAILDAICRVFDDLMPGFRSSITVLDARGERLRLSAAPNLPAGFVERMADLPVAGPDAGLCGLAVQRRAPVFAHDLAADPAWAKFRDVYRAHGLVACWTVPFMSESGRPLGTLAVFSAQSRGPAAHELAVIEQLGHLAGIAIERKRSEQELKVSEERYARALEASNDGLWEWNPVTDEMFISERARQLFGLAEGVQVRTRAELKARGNFHPDDAPRIEAAIQASRALQSEGFDIEYRVTGQAGGTRWIRSRGKVFPGTQGRATVLTGSLTDVTEKKKAEQALRMSEERYAHAMEGSDAGHWDWNIVTDEMFVSERAREMLALPPGTLPARRADIMALVPEHPDDRERMGGHVRVSIRSGRHERDYRVVPRPGEVRWLRSRGKVYKDARGAAVRMTGSLTDITARRRAADELRESEARFRALTELSSDWYWEQDENLRFTYLSSQAGALTGYSGESSLGKTRWEIASMTPLSCSWAEHQGVLAARQPFRDLECRRVGSDGTVRYLSMSGAPIFDEQGGFKGYQGVGRNITERKRIEEELRARQEMLDLAQKAARAVAFEWRIGDGRGENRWSPDLEAMYGLAPGTYDGSYESWKKLVHPDDWPAVKEAIGHAHRTGDVAAEYRVVHPDGSTHWLQAKGRMFFDAEGKPVRMVGFMHDVTERRQAEEELKRMERQLRQAQRLEAMGTLAGGIAHDFNNILGAILGYGEMALRDAPKGSRLHRDLDSIITAGERGRALVDRVLAFSRSGVGERVAVHVEKVVREALDLLSAKLPPNVTLHAKLHAGRAAMLGDATQVHQVLMNLATNAVQAMPSGGILRVRLDTVRIDAARVPTIGTLAAADYLVLKVADTGIGIAPEIIDRIFDPFFTTKEVGTGTGLGLSLVHGIVTELGGAIDVASTPGAGSTFTVYLPRSGEASDSFQKEEPELPRGDGQRVLVVDDEEPLVQLATRTLEELGYAPVGFTSSTAALAAFRADPQRFDAVITDERMPGMSGSALIREVRGIRDRIPVVLMSGFVGGAVASRAREAGAEEVLKKPLSARDLAASLARVLHP